MILINKIFFNFSYLNKFKYNLIGQHSGKNYFLQYFKSNDKL